MTYQNIVSGATEDEVWQQINEQFQKDADLLSYNALIEQNGRQIVLDIDIDLGGGFESGYETTTLSSPLHGEATFKFVIHEEHLTDEIGKFFGMQDVVIGYDDFDKKFIIKTNNELKVKELFSNAAVRESLLSLTDFTFGIVHHSSFFDHTGSFLEFFTENGITDAKVLREIYKVFYTILEKLDVS